MQRKPITIGQRFGKLVVTGPAESTAWSKSSGRRQQWAVLCDCGSTAAVPVKHLYRGHTKSCGCLRSETAVSLRFKHGQAAPRTGAYRAVEALKRRCTNPGDPQWKNYGGRGITVCARWRSDTAVFLVELGPRPGGVYPSGMSLWSIDRKDNDGGYWCGKSECPECGPLGRVPNCRWATVKDNQNNRRSNVFLTVGGVTLTIAEWARRIGMKYGTLYNRIRLGWDHEMAVIP